MGLDRNDSEKRLIELKGILLALKLENINPVGSSAVFHVNLSCP